MADSNNPRKWAVAHPLHLTRRAPCRWPRAHPLLSRQGLEFVSPGLSLHILSSVMSRRVSCSLQQTQCLVYIRIRHISICLKYIDSNPSPCWKNFFKFLFNSALLPFPQKRFDVFTWQFYSAIYLQCTKSRAWVLFSVVSFEGTVTEYVVTWPPWPPRATLSRARVPFSNTHTHHTHHHHHHISWLYMELPLMHVSCQSSHPECEHQEKRKKSSFPTVAPSPTQKRAPHTCEWK